MVGKTVLQSNDGFEVINSSRFYIVDGILMGKNLLSIMNLNGLIFQSCP